MGGPLEKKKIIQRVFT